MNEKTGTSVIFITHDLGVVSELCDTVIVMYTAISWNRRLQRSFLESRSIPIPRDFWMRFQRSPESGIL